MREHIDSVRAFLLASLRDSMTVEDLVQETFLTAWKVLDRYDRQLPFGP
ncbi:MAG TPA: RNA polymerase factor sigma-70, partial [Planctomycetes bacterium]|nr:RNA polymerase factor sigma-70 [Planctomycetota bacterium]